MTISGAKYREGVAYSPDGAVYVQHTDGATMANPIFTGVVLAANGTGAAPAYAFTNAPGTGMYLVSGVIGSLIAGGVNAITWNATGLGIGGGANSYILSDGSNQLRYGPSSAGTTSRTEINKAVTAFTDAAAKTVFTITIPNAAHSASILVRVTGSLGAGGAIGANEATATNCYIVSVTRTAGVNATAAISAAFGAAATAVAGANTVTATASLAAVSGAVGATNTIDVQVTITKNAGASDNHTCVAHASLLNANATGVTIA